MKLILTSGGISNKSIENEFKSFLGKDFKNLKMLFCITASNFEGGNMCEWLVDDLIYFKNLGFQIDVCDINGVSAENFLPRFEWSDVIFFEGGNTEWLKNSIEKSGLQNHLKKLLETRIYIGASAGSCVLSPKIYNDHILLQNKIPNVIDGLGFTDFQFLPHLNNEDFPERRKENILNLSQNFKEIDNRKIYVLDDNSAIFIDNNNLKVISEGQWFVF